MDAKTKLRITSLQLAIEITKIKAQRNPSGVPEGIYAEAERVFKYLYEGTTPTLQQSDQKFGTVYRT